MEHLVFTYGTLMRGESANLRFGEMDYVADGVLRDYGIYEAGSFPAAVPVKGFSVYGELYEVEDEVLRRLDEYEGEGSLYIRRLVKIEAGPKVFDAWFYEYNRSVDGLELRAPVGKWTSRRKPIADYAWYVCYGSNLLGRRFAEYAKKTGSIVYAEKPYMLKGEIYFAMESGRWDGKGVCFLDLSKVDCESYGWAYLVDKDRIMKISEEEGKSWYPVQSLGKDEYGIDAYTVTSDRRSKENEPCIDYLTVIAAGLKERYDLSQNEMGRYLNCNRRLHIDDSSVEEIIRLRCS